MRLISCFALVIATALGVSGDLLGVPTVPFTPKNGSFDLARLSSIIVDSAYQDSVDSEGQTLIPPTLLEFARTFSSDLASSVNINVSVKTGTSGSSNSIFLTLGNSSDYLDAAGRPTLEGYSLDVSGAGVFIKGAGPLGAWWGTRTVLQQAILNNGTISYGTGVDAPGWGIRGVMLDLGRKYYPPSFAIEMCAFLSMFKQNTLHLHLSDNLYNNVDIYSYERSMELYAAFRLLSNNSAVAGLSTRTNESYTYATFQDMQSSCASRGVTIIPELEAPGHALVITQWKPDLALSTDLSLLNISHPATIPTMQTIWSTFLPWFQSKTVHIGADEYDSDYASEYIRFVDVMESYVREQSNGSQSVRIWGTFAPANMSKAIEVQHWEFFEQNPYFAYIKNNYSVLNSDDAFYVVNKYSGSYPPSLNLTRVFTGSPDHSPYAPNIFDTTNTTNNPSRSNPYILGQLAALWNDYGPNASSVSEAYFALRDGLPALGDKQWGGNLSLSSYLSIINPLVAHTPGQNLDRTIASKTNTIFVYDFRSTVNHSVIQDMSGNGYHGLNKGCLISNGTLKLDGACEVAIELGSKGRNYTLAFSVKPMKETPGVLFEGPESSLLAGNGSISNVTLVTGGEAYSLNYSLPIGEWTQAKLIGRGNQTFLEVGSSEVDGEANKTRGGTGVMEFITKIGINGESFAWAPMAILAPLDSIGGHGFVGEMRDVMLLDEAPW